MISRRLFSGFSILHSFSPSVNIFFLFFSYFLPALSSSFECLFNLSHYFLFVNPFFSFFFFFYCFYPFSLLNPELKAVSLFFSQKKIPEGIILNNKKKNRQLAIFAPQYYRRRYDA